MDVSTDMPTSVVLEELCLVARHREHCACNTRIRIMKSLAPLRGVREAAIVYAHVHTGYQYIAVKCSGNSVRIAQWAQCKFAHQPNSFNHQSCSVVSDCYPMNHIPGGCSAWYFHAQVCSHIVADTPFVGCSSSSLLCARLPQRTQRSM